MQRVTHIPALPARPADGHKGTFGRVMIVAGSVGMSGAAILSGLSALRSGAGLVYLAVPEAILDIVASYEPSYLTWPLPCSEAGQLTPAARDFLLEKAEEMSAVAMGPGLGQSHELPELMEAFYGNLSLPLVVDADGLNNLVDSEVLLAEPPGPRILTPHPGEFSRLSGLSIEEVQQNREDVAFYFAGKSRAIVILKGPGTVVTDGERVFVNTTGNSGLATGGTGDVLTGLLVSLLGQGMDPFDAACLGVHLHGMAGDLAAADLSQPGLIASDLPVYLTKAFQQLSRLET